MSLIENHSSQFWTSKELINQLFRLRELLLFYCQSANNYSTKKAQCANNLAMTGTKKYLLQVAYDEKAKIEGRAVLLTHHGGGLSVH